MKQTINVYYKTKLATVRDSEKDDCFAIARHMREDDKNEIWATKHYSPSEAMLCCFEKSTSCLTVERSGFPVAMFGIVPCNLLGREASIWLLGTPGIEGIKKAFAKHSRRFIDEMLEQYPVLFNYCDIRNSLSMNWLKWCGAKFGDIVPYGVERKPFQYFEFTKG